MCKVQKLLHLKGLHHKWVMFRVNRQLAGTKSKTFEKKRRLLNKLPGFNIGEGTKIAKSDFIYIN